jgi:CRP/FNR family cyclic AMP-dependent transcriptional regulator
MTISPVEIVALGAVLTNIAAYAMRTMIPLRMAAISTNILFIAYSIMGGVVPTLILHVILLPLNSYRLIQMQQLVRDIDAACRADLQFDWIKDFTTRRAFAAGTVLFERGAPASEMYILLSGRCRLHDLRHEFVAGDVIGELGLVTNDNVRTQTIECVEPTEALVISYDELRRLCLQNPQFSFYFLKLASARLLNTISVLEADNRSLKLTRPPPAVAAAPVASPIVAPTVAPSIAPARRAFAT